MKKIMISLLMIAATLNAMAITYTGKVQVVLRATSNNAACGAVVATSDALNDGLNPMYYAELNDEGKQVLVYVEYEGTRYEHFGSSATTMRNMPLIMKANASSQYKLEFYEMEGTIEIYDKVAGANIDKSQDYIFTITDAQKNTVIADRFIINYVPAPTPTSYTVTPNSFGYASFSAAEATVIPTTGVTVYKGAINGEVLDLSPITDYIPANTGVIVKGTAGQPYEFEVTSAAVADLSDNALKAYTDWVSHSGTIYVLKDEALYRYTGSDFPANKAYLQISSANNAPKRISMRFNSTTAIENVELEAVKAEKFIENGQVLIKRGENVYNVQGQIVK